MWTKIKAFLKRFLPIPGRTFLAQMQMVFQAIDGIQSRLLVTQKQMEQNDKEIAKEIERLDENLGHIQGSIAIVLEGHSNNMLEHVKQLADILIQQERITQEKYELIEKELRGLFNDTLAIKDEITNLSNVAISLKNETKSMKLEFSSARFRKKMLYNHSTERQSITSFHQFRQRPKFKDDYIKLISNLDSLSKATVAQIIKRQELLEGADETRLNLFTFQEQERLEHIEIMNNNVLKVSDDCYCLGEYRLPINHFEACIYFDRHGIDLIQNIEWIKDKDIIDVGAFIGDSLPILAPLTKKKVYSFESIRENYELIFKTIELNMFDNVIPINKALGDTTGEIIMYTDGSSSTLIENNNNPIEIVTCITLDSFIHDNDNEIDVGLIKVDIEGAEQRFLAGAKNAICTYKPILLISIYHNPEDFFYIKPMIESWGLGYRFRVHKPVDFSVSREVLLIGEVIE